MKSLLDIQQDIRKLEENVSAITTSIKEINSSLEELRGKTKDVEIDYKRIELLAELIPFNEHPISDFENETELKTYLELLLNIVRLSTEKEYLLNQFIFIQWLKSKGNITLSLKKLYKDCYKMKSETYYEMIKTIPEDYREFFIVDALILANIGNSTNTEIYKYIVDLAILFGINKERLFSLSLVARVVLCQSLSNLNEEDESIFLDIAELFYYYINDYSIKEKIRAGVKSEEKLKEEPTKQNTNDSINNITNAFVGIGNDLGYNYKKTEESSTELNKHHNNDNDYDDDDDYYDDDDDDDDDSVTLLSDVFWILGRLFN